LGSEDKEECEWELELIRLSSLTDLLRLAAASNSITVLMDFWSSTLNKRVLGTFANNYGAMKLDIFSYVVYEAEEEGGFLIYKADEGGEQYDFAKVPSAAGSITFPIVKLAEEPHWFSKRVSNVEHEEH